MGLDVECGRRQEIFVHAMPRSRFSLHGGMNTPDLSELPPPMAQMLQSLRDGGEPMSTFLCKRGRRFDKLLACPPNLRGRMGECYRNAGRLALANASLTYHEGFGFDPSIGIPIRHGWVVDPEGHVIDPTWAYSAGSVYFGIGLRTDFMWKRVVAQGTWCVWKDWFDLSGDGACEGLPGMLDPRWHSRCMPGAAS